MVKVVNGVAEEGRVAVRNVRRDVMHDLRELKKEGEAGEDDERRAESRPAEADRRGDRRDRRAPEGKGRGDPGGVSASARYVAIITDGNGRWAQQRGLPVLEGHRAGADVVKERLRDAAELGIEELTVFSFSTENWSRPEEEVERPDEDVRRAHRGRDAGARRGGRADALHRPPRGRRPGAGRAHALGRGDDRGQRAHHASSSPSTTAAGRRSSTRREASRGAPRRSSATTSTRPRCTTPTS